MNGYTHDNVYGTDLLFFAADIFINERHQTIMSLMATWTVAATRQEQQHQTVTHFTNTKANTAVTLPLTGFGFIK